jgi:hypothetical protein
VRHRAAAGDGWDAVHLPQQHGPLTPRPSPARSGWNVTLVNSAGVVKQPATPPTIDAAQAVNVTIRPAPQPSAWVWGQPVSVAADAALTVTVAAGDVVVVGVAASP